MKSAKARRAITSRAYDGPLPDHTAIRVWESYAKHVLMCIDDEYAGLKYGDKPDLVDVERSLGVEVTDAIDGETREAESLYSRWSEELEGGRKQKYEERISQCGGRLVEGCLIGPASSDLAGIVLDAFEKKLKKLNGGGYKHLDSYRLFIRSDILILRSDVEKVLASLTSVNETYEMQYQQVILSVPCYNYRFDLYTNAAIMCDFPSSDQYRIGMAARQEVIDAQCQRSGN